MVRCTTRGHVAEKSWSTGATKATTEKKLAILQTPFILSRSVNLTGISFRVNIILLNRISF